MLVVRYYAGNTPGRNGLSPSYLLLRCHCIYIKSEFASVVLFLPFPSCAGHLSFNVLSFISNPFHLYISRPGGGSNCRAFLPIFCTVFSSQRPKCVQAFPSNPTDYHYIFQALLLSPGASCWKRSGESEIPSSVSS